MNFFLFHQVKHNAPTTQTKMKKANEESGRFLRSGLRSANRTNRAFQNSQLSDKVTASNVCLEEFLHQNNLLIEFLLNTLFFCLGKIC